MPSERVHISQATGNAKLLKALRQSPVEHPDWVITVAFYTVLHLVEAYFARHRQFRHCRSHDARLSRVAGELQAIDAQYVRLYWASRRARYDCPQITPQEAAEELADAYEPIRTHLCGELNVFNDYL
jgi:hypothetical protein